MNHNPRILNFGGFHDIFILDIYVFLLSLMLPSQTLQEQDDKTVTDEGFDFIILHAKYYVYKYHIKEQLPTIKGFIEYLKYTYKVDKYMYSIDMSNEKFIKKWASYEPMMM